MILDFVTQDKGHTLAEALDTWHSLADGKCSCDYGFHMSITDWNDQVRDELKDMTWRGVTSYKLYMAYDNLKVNDKEIFEILSAVEQENGILGIHCENGEIIKALTEKLKSQQKNIVSLHPKSRPAEAEAEAVHRLLTIAKLTNTPVNIVHLSSELGLKEVQRARRSGQQVFAETCPQYLILNDSEYNRPGFESAAYVCAPPLRKKEDIRALWKAVAASEIDMIGTDHCSFHMNGQKTRGMDDFTRIPGGIPGVEHRPELFFQYGVMSGNTNVEMMCNPLLERPAKLFEMYPKKGAILPGSDADLVIWDPDREWTISAKDQVQNADNTPYEGIRGTGMPAQVFLRGCPVAEYGRVVEELRGRYVHRKPREI